MRNIRFMTAAAVTLFISGIAAGGAAAQTTTNETPGKPLQLLRIVEQPNHPIKTKPHNKRLSKHLSKIHTAVAKRDPVAPVQTADATPLANPIAATSMPAANAPAGEMVGALATPRSAALNLPIPGELVVGGQTVQVASPDAVNEIDLAANAADAQGGKAAPGSAAASPSVTNDTAQVPIDAVSTNPQGSDVASAPPTSPVGSTSWLLQVFAALGGAVAAGSVAWFLIGSAPQRTYG